MRRILFTVLAFAFLLGETFAQNEPPRFEDYAVSSKFSGKPARVNLRSHPQARMFRTMLRNGVERGARFAGHLAVNIWGCGTDCARVGIVDLKTGRAYVTPFYIGYGVSYRIDSKLFIVEPLEQLKERFGDDIPERAQHTRYYVWRNNRLVLIYPKEAQNDEAEKFWQ
jgi:translation initiation factor IF-1